MRVVFVGTALITAMLSALGLHIKDGKRPRPTETPVQAKAQKESNDNYPPNLGRSLRHVPTECTIEDVATRGHVGIVNGVTLTLSAKGLPADKPETVEVEWRVQYTGPRPPLVIRRPSLTKAFQRPYETELAFFLQGESGKTYGFGFSNEIDLFGIVPYNAPPDYYIRIPGAGSVSGKLHLSVAELRAPFIKQFPSEFRQTVPPSEAFVKLYFSPSDRGETTGLDAWTGSVESQITSFELRRQ